MAWWQRLREQKAVRPGHHACAAMLGATLVLTSSNVSAATPYRQCIQRAAAQFDLSPSLLQAIRQQEGGRRGSAHRNTNGTVDYGVMQINSIWLPTLAKAGYTRSILRWSACNNIMAGAWILAKAMHDANVWHRTHPDARKFWRAVGAYHSQTPRLNRAYAVDIWHKYTRLLRSH